MKIFTAQQMYEADKATEANQGITSIDLMERAASQAFYWIDQQLQGASTTIHVFCGIGNNGGDGLALSRMLLHKKYNVVCYVVNYSEKRSECFLINYARLKQENNVWPAQIKSENDFPVLPKEDIVVDAIFGIGLNRPPEGWLKKLIIHINKSQTFILSIDVPSGLFIDIATPHKEAIIQANLTLTFQTPKLPFFLPETAGYTDSFKILDIGLDPEFLLTTPTISKLILKNDVLAMYQPRNKFDHKGTFGHALIVGGSYGKMGAVVLAAKSCLRAGAGKVTVLIPQCGYQIIQTTVPEAMVITDLGEKHIQLLEFKETFDVFGVGIGLGTEKQTLQAFEHFLKNQNKPLVLDADALNLLSKNKKLLNFIPKKSILTPHPGELQRLIGKWTDDFDKLNKTKKLSKKLNCIIVIKGAFTITVYQDNFYINTTGNPGMATAGSGDVLTGVITGLLSQGYDALIAAIMGVYIHGNAGDLASHHLGFNALIASDLVDFLGDAYVELLQKEPPKPIEQEQNQESKTK